MAYGGLGRDLAMLGGGCRDDDGAHARTPSLLAFFFFLSHGRSLAPSQEANVPLCSRMLAQSPELEHYLGKYTLFVVF